MGEARGDLGRVRDVLGEARRPVVVAGVGTRAHGRAVAHDVALALAELGRRTNVPILTTYKARGIVSDRADFSAGVMTGATIEGPVLDAADLIIGVGLDPVELIPAPWAYRAGVVLIGSWPVDDSSFFGSGLHGEVVGGATDLAALVHELGAVLSTTWARDAGQAVPARRARRVGRRGASRDRRDDAPRRRADRACRRPGIHDRHRRRRSAHAARGPVLGGRRAGDAC